MLINGDCTVIQTPLGKTIVIDTGEEDHRIVEYLLDRKIKKIDYIIASHFDSDHCAKVEEVIEKLNVKNIIISKQSEESQNYNQIIQTAQKNKVKIIEIKAGDKIDVEKDLYFYFLWPMNDEMIRENGLNNNSIVCRMQYKNFSALFTGDIEKIAEEKILNEYKEMEFILDTTVLKIAHHGSKTSSTEDFINTVKPKIALIGVGRNNKFGHPNEDVLSRLNDLDIRIFRTDQNGEITISVDKKGKISIDSLIK